jgi:TPR repeat protein
LEELKPLAEQGDANAQSYLGLMYHQGLGVIQDNIRAYMWLHLSASQGSRVAKINLKKVRWEMNSTDETKAYELAKRCLVKNYKDC